MNVSELYDLTIWIENEIVKTQLVKKYQALHGIIQQNLQPNQKVPLAAQKEALLSALATIKLEQLTKDQLNFLDNLGIKNVLGSEGIEIIEDILYKNAIDIATAVQKFQEIIQRLNQGIQKSNQIKGGLDNCVEEEEYESEDEVLMRIAFTGKATMRNVTDFKNWGNIWYDIGRGIAMAHDLPPESVKIIGATKGSIVIELAVIAAIATTASGIILAALRVAEKVLDIRMKAEEIRGLKLKNDKVVKELEKEAEYEKKIGIEEITSSMVEVLKLNSNNQGDKVTALDKAIKNLVDFVEHGGEVDFVVPDGGIDSEEPKENQKAKQELRLAFQEIRKLEKKLLIEHKEP